jgi:hypothetical protein
LIPVQKIQFGFSNLIRIPYRTGGVWAASIEKPILKVMIKLAKQIGVAQTITK